MRGSPRTLRFCGLSASRPLSLARTARAIASRSRRFGFAGQRSEGFRALAVAMDHGLPVRAIRRYWAVNDGEPCGPDWEMAFWRPATCSQR
jgi:hypothetical protein